MSIFLTLHDHQVEGNPAKLPVCSKKQALAEFPFQVSCDFSLEEKLGRLMSREGGGGYAEETPRADGTTAVKHGTETAGRTLA